MSDYSWPISTEITAMHLELTTRCNAACPMCPRHIDNGRAINPNLILDEITFENFKEWFSPEFLAQQRRVYACGNYGDPIAAKDTLEIYKYIREHSPFCNLVIHTNGSARNEKWWAELATVINGYRPDPLWKGEDYVVFSVDGLWDTNHLYRKNTNFDTIYRNMQAFTSAGGKARWDYIVFEHNEHQVEEAKQMAEDMGFEFFNIKRTTRWQGYNIETDNRGFYEVRNPDGSSYLLRQAKDSKYQHENAIEFKQKIRLIPQYITNDEFKRMFPSKHAKDTMSVFDPETKEQITIKHNTLGVDCRARLGKYQSNNEIFVTGTGHVYPCCFLGGEPWRAPSNYNAKDTSKEMVQLNGGMDSISLHESTLDNIMLTPLFQRYLPMSFEKGCNMRSFQCSSCCGDEYNQLDQGELGDNNRSLSKKQERESHNVG